LLIVALTLSVNLHLDLQRKISSPEANPRGRRLVKNWFLFTGVFQTWICVVIQGGNCVTTLGLRAAEAWIEWC
jgi:hypothetical protein